MILFHCSLLSQPTSIIFYRANNIPTKSRPDDPCHSHYCRLRLAHLILCSTISFPLQALINKTTFLIQELFISPQKNVVSSRDALWAHFLSYIYNHTITLRHLLQNCLSPPSFAHGTSMSSKLDEATKWYLRKSSGLEVSIAQIAFPPFLQKKEANHCPARELGAVDRYQAVLPSLLQHHLHACIYNTYSC